MKAVVWNGPYELTLQDVPRPTPGEGEVLVKTEVVGICGSDLEIYDGRFTQTKPPMIIGHEGGGIVEAVGPGVTHFKPGDRVIVECLVYCGQCENCRKGRYNLCDFFQVLGMIDLQGEYAEYFVAPERNCYHLPEAISWPEAGFIDTLAGPMHGINSANVELGHSVAVFGGGSAGLFFCKLAKLRGAATVYLIEPQENRRSFGTRYGADVMLDPLHENVVDALRDATNGRGVDIAIEAAGSEKALQDAMGVLKKGGELVIYGVFGGGPIALDIQPIQLYEFAIQGINGYPFQYPKAITYIQDGTIPVKDLISHTFRLEDVPEAFSSGLIAERRENYMKGIVLL
ncbi:alcohol dehydrogenase catalytic domain-containing protein [candidate division KSB3 bacterium]|uniref:Alcohol dehydrogenase catalytic domain-containing protein n=1 Tax=candidate division KSB3 bacterium TaxID=2044937 RepID=A0A9D5K0H9_9BACT|nr:alcohol dehydrogenase catalytic domain-containing protein [candidate division KSB3 bacterium]MBD3327649.1 alcohol dehydrogenase catalytic domain-containing protein [candidate division KSB3 bacterium]